jgi:protein phosphatase
MRINIPDFSLVLLMGASGSGKSSFAARHFKPTEILSSDRCRGFVSDDETDQGATKDAFDVLYYIAAKRLAARRLTVIDATNLRPEDRKHAVELAKRFHALPVIIALDVPEEICIERNRSRPDRDFGPNVVRSHVRLFRQSLRGLSREGFRVVHELSGLERIDAAEITREPLYNDKRGDHGPFDIIGDIHGCYDELLLLLEKLGYRSDATAWRHPEGRRVIFLGDLVDRGPRTPDVVRLVMDMVETGAALCVPGNHEMKLLRKLNGKDVKLTHGLAETVAQIEALPDEERGPFIARAKSFIDKLVSHYWLDDGKLVVAHAGLKEEMQGRGSGAVRQFCYYGETTGETDEYGLPVRFNWAAEYRGKAMVVYGHTPTPRAEWLNNTICIDTGCVFGGELTALRYPERELVSIPAAMVYSEPVRPLIPEMTDGLSSQQTADDMLDIEDVSGKRQIATRHLPQVMVREENAAAAIEIMSRFCVDPRWLIYLPPTMSPSETSRRDGLLEHPDEAFAYYRKAGIDSVVIEEKHMGSRAVVVLARDGEAARRRFGVSGDERGVIYTRTGRSFFNDRPLGDRLLDRLSGALDRSGFWEKFSTDWVCLDAELLPWSAKAQSLIDELYAPVGESAVAGLNAAVSSLKLAVERGVDAGDLLDRFADRACAAGGFAAAYRRYVWPVASIDDLKLAPFHLLATEGAVHADRDHLWHMQALAEICAADPGVLLATAHREVPLDDPSAVDGAIAWWTDLTARGGEGMVVKPKSFVARGRKGIIQPALKCRGAEYLRLIYGPEYSLPRHLERLRERGLGAKRSLAIREFSLGLEALHRFVEREPLRRIHECVFGVLAMESEPVDPRL